jgi:hypothetical protein
MKNQFCSKFRFFIPLLVLGIVPLLALAVFGLWNGVLADVVGVKTITYWQALGILVLARILFGGFPGRHGGPFGPPWRQRMMLMKRWQSLTPEQRDKMREEMRQRFGDWPKPPWCDSGHAEAEGTDDTKKA